MGGGALYLRVDLATGAEPTVVANNLWVNNQSGRYGGALYFDDSVSDAASAVLHNTLVSSAPSAIYVVAGRVDVVNSILVGQSIGTPGTYTARVLLSNSMGSAEATTIVVIQERPVSEPPGGTGDQHRIYLPMITR